MWCDIEHRYIFFLYGLRERERLKMLGGRFQEREREVVEKPTDDTVLAEREESMPREASMPST